MDMRRIGMGPIVLMSFHILTVYIIHFPKTLDAVKIIKGKMQILL